MSDSSEAQLSLVEYALRHEPVITVLSDEFSLFLLYFIQNFGVVSMWELRDQIASPYLSLEEYISNLSETGFITIRAEGVGVTRVGKNLLTTFGLSMTWDDLKDVDRQIEQLQASAEDYAKQFRHCYDRVDELRPALRDIENEADQEAARMKELNAQASAAYHRGDHASARYLADLSNEHERRCRALNDQANQLRNQIKELGHKGRQAETICKSLNAQVKELKAYRRTLPRGVK